MPDIFTRHNDVSIKYHARAASAAASRNTDYDNLPYKLPALLHHPNDAARLEPRCRTLDFVNSDQAAVNAIFIIKHINRIEA